MNYRDLALCGVVFAALAHAPSRAQETPAPQTEVETPKPSEPSTEGQNQTPPEYLDNRSTPESLIRSYYNAINRQEYARAYSYYAPDTTPKPFPEFQSGYESTASVKVLFGKAEGEGAAGSAYWSKPVAIESTGKDGKTEVFNGCYRIRLANPAIQGVPYVPMSILDGTLEKSDKPLDQSVPEGCEAP